LLTEMHGLATNFGTTILDSLSTRTDKIRDVTHDNRNTVRHHPIPDRNINMFGVFDAWYHLNLLSDIIVKSESCSIA
jgi:hypothetical protein